jgi:hypothetical protein
VPQPVKPPSTTTKIKLLIIFASFIICALPKVKNCSNFLLLSLAPTGIGTEK